MIALYGSVFAFLALAFNYVDYAYPDPLSYLPADAYQGGVAYQMSAFIVLGLVCVILMYFIHRSIEQDPTRADIWIRRWALYLVLFIAGFTIVGDLIVLLNTFLSGNQLTTPFLLKVFLVLGVAAVGFMHFLADLRGYWAQFPARSRAVSIGVIILGICTIGLGFLIIGTPQQARLYLFDDQKVNDLQTIQSQVLYYWQQSGKMPASLLVLNDSLSNFAVPTDPQTGNAYTYKPMGGTSFQLCATFNADSRGIPTLTNMTAPVAPGGYQSGVNDNWQHGAGETCFLRTIDPTLYPPVKK